MAEQICYLKLNRDVKVHEKKVHISDLAGVFCADATACAKIKCLPVHTFSDKKERCIISVLKIIQLIGEVCPQLTVESIGETDVLVEYAEPGKGAFRFSWIACKVLFVCLISFFGTAFTIMAYHNDIGISRVFQGLYKIVTGSEPTGISVLEWTYSIGLAIGIIVFFNHVGKVKITSDPTPIEVEMCKYETDVSDTVVENAQREGQIIDV